jgi:hypothetical protein
VAQSTYLSDALCSAHDTIVVGRIAKCKLDVATCTISSTD